MTMIVRCIFQDPLGEVALGERESSGATRYDNFSRVRRARVRDR